MLGQRDQSDRVFVSAAAEIDEEIGVFGAPGHPTDVLAAQPCGIDQTAGGVSWGVFKR